MGRKKRAVIAKVKKGTETKFVKYEYVNNLVRFARYLDVNFDDWYYMNVFDRESRQQIANFTKNRRPTHHP